MITISRPDSVGGGVVAVVTINRQHSGGGGVVGEFFSGRWRSRSIKFRAFFYISGRPGHHPQLIADKMTH